ncbi:RNA recognition motif domain-containing protein [Leptolyngbya sp. PCC 6406]|uniref:RNA recognition motif domain-containing protein n=1 Tax=Leptolyngbya sp. PCC 6406 TaxID=1173264 RepID=UPI0002AC6920|nr:RNA-binding protein [Leptolyngbya sp. PCC 6406]
MSVRIYVGNLPKEIERESLESVFSEHTEEIISVKLISDRKTGKCRGFGFVTVKTDEQADVIVEKFNGFSLEESELKVEKALPRSKTKEEAGESAPTATVTPARRKGKGGSGSGASKGSGGKGSLGDAEVAQPDPRWAQDLAKLKELLAAQTTSS